MKFVIAAGRYAGRYDARMVRHCHSCAEQRPGAVSPTGRSWQCSACSQTVLITQNGGTPA